MRASVRPLGAALAWLTVSVCLFGVPVTASAQQGWSGAIADLSSPSSIGVGTPQIAGDSAGNATVVWAQHAGGQSHMIQAARFRPADGTWTAPSTLSAPGTFTTGARVAADESGNAIAVWVRSGVVQAARYSGAAGTWGSPVDLSATGQTAQVAHVAMDPAGSAIVIWGQGTSYNAQTVHAIRYAEATASWGTRVDLLTTATSMPNPRIAIDSSGDAIAVFVVEGLVRAVRYRMATNAWGLADAISTAGATPSFVGLGMDDQGNAMAVWIRETTGAFGVVQAVRFDRAASLWTLPVSLSLGGSTSPALDVGPSGDAVITWVRNNPSPMMDVETVRYVASSNGWSGVVRLSSGSNYYTGVPVALDASGNALAVWGHMDVDLRFKMQSARFAVTRGTWSTAAYVPGVGEGRDPAVVFDGVGNAVAIWTPDIGGGSVNRATRWLASPAAPTVTGVVAGPGTLAVSFAPPPAEEALFAAVNYGYSLDAGATWTIRDPASPVSPVLISGVTDFVTYALRLRAFNTAGAGLPTQPLMVRSGPGSNVPTDLAVTSVVGNTVAIAWATPTVGAVPTGYLLEGGIYPGEVLASIPTGSLAPMFTFVAPTGAFYARIHAVAGTLRSAPSNEIRIFVNVPTAPSAPAGLLGLVNGSSVTLSWVNTYAGGAPTSLLLNVTGAIATTLPLPVGEGLTFAGVPPGTYTLSVSAANASGVSAPSNTVTLTFPRACDGVPGVPTNFVSTKSGFTIFVSWGPPANGPAVAGYTVHVTGTYVGGFPTTGRSLSGTASPGSYTLSVVATNACGAGTATPTQTVVIP